MTHIGLQLFHRPYNYLSFRCWENPHQQYNVNGRSKYTVQFSETAEIWLTATTNATFSLVIEKYRKYCLVTLSFYRLWTTGPVPELSFLPAPYSG